MILGILYHWPLIQPQSSWNVRLGRHTGSKELNVLRYRCEHSDGPENAPKYSFRDPNMKEKFSLPDSSPNLPYPNPIYSGSLQHFYSSAFYTRLAPLYSPKSKSWICSRMWPATDLWMFCVAHGRKLCTPMVWRLIIKIGTHSFFYKMYFCCRLVWYLDPSLLTTVCIIGIVVSSCDFIIPLVMPKLFKATEWYEWLSSVGCQPHS